MMLLPIHIPITESWDTMRDDDLIREVDRRHVIQLFDLFADSKFDPFDLIEAYSRTYSRIRADEGSEYHVLKQPINVFNDIVRENNLKKTENEVDHIIMHWMAEFMYLSDMKRVFLSGKYWMLSLLYGYTIITLHYMKHPLEMHGKKLPVRVVKDREECLFPAILG